MASWLLTESGPGNRSSAFTVRCRDRWPSGLRAPETSLCPQHRTGVPLGQSEELQPLSQHHPFLSHLGLASHPNGDWSQPCLTCDRAGRGPDTLLHQALCPSAPRPCSSFHVGASPHIWQGAQGVLPSGLLFSFSSGRN
ncbi:hypothetical protein QTO34_009703 [Cnephaeus nilssonii]|uniref:Uncharacterized protein n=1 Tax=Cnephaeus nilssonii TaxID=3371016 RepID=A0AA40HI96_CNENI|nr:hypothetical protein QTO34_009703 [Eptesicus nilssonii]